MSGQSTRVRRGRRRSLGDMLRVDRLPPPDRLAETLLKFPERKLRATAIAPEVHAVTFVARNERETAVLRAAVTLPSSPYTRAAVSSAELSVTGLRAVDFCRVLERGKAWELIVHLCRHEDDRTRRSSVEPAVGTISRVLFEEAIRALTRDAPLVFFGSGLSWAGIAAARRAQVSIGMPDEVTATEFLPARSDRVLVVESSGPEDALVAEALRAFGGERLVHVGPRPVYRTLTDHWDCVDEFELPDPYPSTYFSIWERRLEKAGPEHNHSRLVAGAKKAVAGGSEGPDTDRLIALLWAECCRLRRSLARKADELDYRPHRFGPRGGPENATELSHAVARGHVRPDHRVLQELECDVMARTLTESIGWALDLARLSR